MVLVLVAVGTSSCATGPAAPPGATVPTSTPAGPYAVPQVITKPYVQKVLNALEVVNAQASRLIISSKSLGAPALTMIGAIDTAPEATIQSKVWQEDLHAGLPNYLPHPGVVHDSVIAILSTTPSCVFLSAIRNFSQVDRDPPVYTSYFAIVQRSGDATTGQNPTPWVISFLGGTASGAAPPDQCP